MNESDEFSSPVATSTTWKKSKPENWLQDTDTTFQQLTDLTVVQSPEYDKENIDVHQQISKYPKKGYSGIKGDSTMNIGKYLIPAYPSEPEEDSFITDNLDLLAKDGFKMGEVDSLTDQLVDNLKTMIIESEEDTNRPVENANSAHFDTPIPPFIVTDNHILRRHSSSTRNKDLDETVLSSRKILSAPSSIYVVLTTPSEASDVQSIPDDVNDIQHHQKVSPLADDEPLDELECDENLINDSFSKYLEYAPNLTIGDNNDNKMDENCMDVGELSHDTILPDESSLSVSNINVSQDETLCATDNSPNLKSPIPSPRSSRPKQDASLDHTFEEARKSSLNTVNYIDPDNSMTTQTLKYSAIHESDVTDLPSPDSNETCEISSPDSDDPNETRDDNFDDDGGEEIEEIKARHKEWQHPNLNETVDRRHQTILEKLSFDSSDRRILFPSRHTIEKPCAAGISSKTYIKIQNNTDLWIQCSISIDDTGKESGFTAQNRLIVHPQTDEDLLITVCPCNTGLCEGTIHLAVDSVISGMLPRQELNCKITAVAESPGIRLMPEAIQFGIQTENKEASFKLTNSSEHELPLSIMLDTENDVFALSDPISNYPTSSFRLTLAPGQIFVGHVEFCPFEQYNECQALLKVYLDAANGTLITEIKVLGTVGHYKLRIPTSKHTLAFRTSPGVPVSTQVPFRNTGNIPCSIKLAVTPPFDVTPSYIASLTPGEDAVCEVSYFPTGTERTAGSLTLSLGADAVVFQVPIEGITTSSGTTSPVVSSLQSILLANKSIVNFGGTEIGRQKEQKLLLKNDSQAQIMCFMLRIVSPCRSFYIINDNISLCCDMVLPAGSSQSVTLGYTPLHTEQHMGELWIRSKTSSSSFCIPLSGHGGLSQVSILNAQQTSSQLWVDMGPITPNKRNTTRITLHNTGPRAAFISGTLETTEGYPLSPRLGWINPKSFVIKENTSRDLFVIFDPTEHDMNFKNRIASLKLYMGDEISRQRFCKVVGMLGGTGRDQDLPFDPTTEFILPCDMEEEEVKIPFLKEGDLVVERQLFGSGIYQLFVSILGWPSEDTGRRSLTVHQTNPRQRPDSRRSSPSCTSTPVEVSPGITQKRPPEWDFSVKALEMTKKMATLHIVNASQETLVYDISFEPHLYSIEPVAGRIAPCGCSELIVKALTSKHFISTILVGAGGQHKSLRISYNPAVSPKPEPIPDKSIVFKSIPVNMTSVAFFEFQNNYGDTMQWKLCSVAPAYVKGADGEPSRVKYSAFCVSVVSGVTPSHTAEKIPITFYPKEPGMFTQCWTFSYSTMSHGRTHTTNNRRIVFEGHATDVTTSRTRVASRNTPHRIKDKVFLKTEELEYKCEPNQHQSQSFKLGNPLKVGSTVKLSALKPPFHLKYSEVLVEAGHSARIPIRFKPSEAGVFKDVLVIDTLQGRLELPLSGYCGTD